MGWLLLFALHLSAQTCPTFTIDSIRTTPPADCGLEDGLIGVFATSDNALSYSADGGASFQNFSVFNGLFPGTYAIVVRDNDTGCEEAAGNATINDPNGPELQDLTITQPTCPDGTANGSIDISAVGIDVEYSIDGGDFYFFDGKFDNLAPGSYTIVLRHGADCLTYFENNPVVLDAPDCSGGGGNADSLTVSISTTPATCNGDTDGALSAEVDGGTPPYTYLWGTGSTDPALNGVGAGDYELTVTDAEGSVVVISTTLAETPAITLALVATPIQAGEAGTVSATPADGTAPYTYLWTTGEETTDIEVTMPGTYGVTVTDANGCTATGAAEVLEADCNDIGVDIDETNPSCDGDPDGTVTALPSGGTPPYTYVWTTGDTTQTVIGLVAANYRVTITDAVGCTATVATALIDPFPIQFGTQTDSVDCAGQSNGSARVDLIFGVNTSILWSTGDTTAMIDNLPAGDYGVTVTNSNGCSDTTTVTIFEPAPLNISVTTTDADDTVGGSALALPTGGTLPYNYEWSTGVSDSLLTDLPVGFYTLNVTDANGCAAFVTFTISEAACGLAATIATTDDNCAGNGVGTAAVSVTGAVGPFVAVFSTGDTTSTLDNLPAGAYSVQVIDSLFCSTEIDFEIGQEASFTVVPSSTPTSCDGADGSIAYSIVGGMAPFVVTLNDSLIIDTIISGLAAGDYTLVVTDATGCTVTPDVAVADGCMPTGCADFIVADAATLLVTDCDTTASLCLELPFFDLNAYDLIDNGEVYTGTTSGCDFDTTFAYAYSILTDGGGTGPYDVQSWSANDSTFGGVINELSDIIDSLAIWDPAGNWQLDTAQQLISGGITGSNYGNLELVQSSSDTVIILQTNILRTANGTEFAFGVGTHELIVTETATGCSDTLLIDVLCADVPGTAFVVPVFLAPGESDTLCLNDLGYSLDSLTVLPGGCAPGNPDVATVALVESCFEVDAVAPGATTECFLLCSALSCDTLIVEVTVLLPGGPDGPKALPDFQTTGQGMPIVVAVLQNDTLGGGITTFEVTLDPENGEASILPDQSINYVPNPDFCGVDSFRYTVCTLEGCASAFVTITVLCNELTVYNGFSPNGDGINDAFTITGLNTFDGHTLYVYNRWGNLVLQSEDYQNDWRGTWQGSDLPSGIYFYVLQLEGEAEPRSGSVTLHR